MQTDDIYLDFKKLSAYSALGVGTLRDYVKSGSMPAFKLKGKILIKRSEFDNWMEKYRINKKMNIDDIVDGVLSDLKG